jgi:hypothetical protein
MQYSQSLTMIVDFIENAMTHDFKIEGGVAREAEIADAYALRFGFMGEDDFSNRSRLEFFCNAVERAAVTLNQSDDGVVIDFDREQGALFTRKPENFLALLDVMSAQQNLDWSGGSETPATPLSAAFREQAEIVLQTDPEALLRLENNTGGYSNRDALYAALLRDSPTGLYTLNDIRGAFRAEAIVEGQRHDKRTPAFWYH